MPTPAPAILPRQPQVKYAPRHSQACAWSSSSCFAMEALVQHFLRLPPAKAHPSPSYPAKVAPMWHSPGNYPGAGPLHLQPSHQGGTQEQQSLGTTTSPGPLQLKPPCQGCLSSALPRDFPWLMPTPVLTVGQSFQVQADGNIVSIRTHPWCRDLFFPFSSFRLGFSFTLLIHCCWFFYIFIFPNKSFNFLILFYSLYFVIVLSFWLVPCPALVVFFSFCFLLWFYFTLLQLFNYSFIFPNIFFIFLILFCILLFDIVLLLFPFFLFFFLNHTTKLVGPWFPGQRLGPSSCGGSSESKLLD